MELRAERSSMSMSEVASRQSTSTPAVSNSLVITLLAIGDACAVALAFALAYVLRFKAGWQIFYAPTTSPLDFYSSLVFWLVPLVLVVYACYRLYVPSLLFDGPNEYARIVSGSTLAMLLVVLVSFFFDSGLVIARGWIIISWFALLFCVGANRFIMRRVVYALRRAGWIGRRVIVVGKGDDAVGLVHRILDTPDSGLQIVARVEPAELLAVDPASGTSALQRCVATANADAVIVSAASVSQLELSAIVRELSYTATDLQLVPGMHEILTTGVQVREIRGLPLVTMNKARITGYDLLLKKGLDYTVAIGVLLVLALPLLLVALAVRLTSPGPVLYRRRVVGQQGKCFDALKFRTMFVNGDEILAHQPELARKLANEGKLVDDPRITPLGRWLRRWSIDEFPQLLNVIRGEMSLVGPRMISEGEAGHFGQWRENLFTVPPGLTGLWQVSGRSELGYEDRVRLDMHYIRSYSILSDIEVLLRTVPAVLKGVGAY
jgi:exopolysaccharide biosynthesis polyprenyl glycosylphosphotransferase